MLARISEGSVSAPWQLRAGQLAGKLLPPVISPFVTSRIYPYSRARQGRLEITAKSVCGHAAAWPMEDVHAWQFVLNGYYDWRLLAIAQAAVRRGELIVEVGANIGTETIGFAHVVGPAGKVLAFEPFSRNAAVLERVVSTAGLGARVEVRRQAAGQSAGELSFVAPDRPGASGEGYLVEGQRPIGGDNIVRVRVEPLDSALSNYGAPALLAIDVEGAELAVLRGARAILRDARPVIVAEACERHLKRAGSSLRELHEELSQQGYLVSAIRRWGLRPVDLEPGTEPCNWVAVPRERKNLLSKISRRIKYCGLLPPWRGINPLAK